MPFGRTYFSGVLAAAAIAAAAAASTAAAPAAVGCKPDAGKQVVVTPTLTFTLLVGPLEAMFMPRQVRAHHLKHGEEMLRGAMSGPALLTGGPIRHVEIQICATSTSSVVTNAIPKIVVVDTTAGKTIALPVAVMEDISAGDADLHYGNNLALATGHRFRVAVTWKGARASFHLHRNSTTSS